MTAMFMLLIIIPLCTGLFIAATVALFLPRPVGVWVYNASGWALKWMWRVVIAFVLGAVAYAVLRGAS